MGYAIQNVSLSSSELLGSECEPKVYQCSGVHPLASQLPSSKIYSKTDSPVKATFLVQPPLEKGIKIYRKCEGHMTKMDASFYGISFKIVLRTGNPMILKPGIHYWGIEIYKKYRNDDPEMTLTYFTAMSNLDWTNCNKNV